jgi:hypothetical protein
VLLNAAGGGGEVPAGEPHEQIDAGAAAALAVLAAAVGAEPASGAVVVVPLESGVAGITAEHPAGRAGPLAVAQVVDRQPAKRLQQLRPTPGSCVEISCHASGSDAVGSSLARDAADVAGDHLAKVGGSAAALAACAVVKVADMICRQVSIDDAAVWCGGPVGHGGAVAVVS